MLLSFYIHGSIRQRDGAAPVGATATSGTKIKVYAQNPFIANASSPLVGFTASTGDQDETSICQRSVETVPTLGSVTTWSRLV